MLRTVIASVSYGAFSPPYMNQKKMSNEYRPHENDRRVSGHDYPAKSRSNEVYRFEENNLSIIIYNHSYIFQITRLQISEVQELGRRSIDLVITQ